eukprot:TRINITY_DN37906_c0_g1_i1.p1 TRINITY_DN37906_c0_g1~~TRINITY_DN37906_c0_g1_i1.p1  ORF type:complete len:697 (+),score=290.36 TRINITY_DN37906_c0_g1_i1:148-2091(+)
MIRHAQDAASNFNKGKKVQARTSLRKLKDTYAKAVEKEPEELQAYLTYGTALLNTNQLDESAEVWPIAASKVTDAVRKEMPHIDRFIAGKLALCHYGKVSMQKDEVYQQGQGNLTEGLALINQQLQLRPLPQILYDRATVRIMLSNSDSPDRTAHAEGVAPDFTKAASEAVRGHLEAKRIHTKLPCAADRPSLVEFPYGDSDALPPTESFESSYTAYTARDGKLEANLVETKYESSEVYISEVRDGYLRGKDAVVTRDVCEGRWSEEKIGAKLTAMYTALGLEGQLKHVKMIVGQFSTSPEVLRDAILKKYADQLTKGDIDATWLDDWVESSKKGCDCLVYAPSQMPRVNLAMNLPSVDVYGDNPVLDQSGRPDVVIPPKPLGTKLRRAVSTAQFAGASFYHFVVEVLPRVVAALEDPNLQDTVIIIPQDSSKNRFIEKFLKLVTPKGRKMAKTYREHAAEVQVESLFVPTWRRDDMVTRTTPPRSALVHLREVLSKGSTPERDTVIYLSRKDTKMRKLKQDNAVFESVQAVAEAAGYKVLRISSGLDAEEAVKAFMRARMVVGVHGGALGNTVFCQPGTVVVEFGFDTPYSHDFVHLSAHLGLEHHLYPLEPSPNGMGAPEVSLAHMEHLSSLLNTLLPPRMSEEL